MSLFSRKGYTALRARDPKTGQIFSVAVEIGSPLHQRAQDRQRKNEKANRQAMRAFKKQMREAKKGIPLAMRSKVNWSQVHTEPATEPAQDTVL